MNNRRWAWGILALFSASPLLGGCAESPFGLARLNPTLQKEWDKDAKFGPNIHTKTDELRQLATSAPNLPPGEQQRLSAELARMIPDERNSLLAREEVRTLAAFPTAESLEGLKAATEHSDADVRAAACEAWRRKGGEAGLENLVKVLSSDTDLDVRMVAARELGAFRQQAAIDALGTALEDPNPALQYRCVQSLKEITGRDLGENVAAWRQFVAGGDAKASTSVSWTEQLRNFF